MIDDKGNKVNKLSIVRDSGTGLCWLVIDKDHCVCVDENIYFESFESLKNQGYLRIQVRPDQISYAVPAPIIKETT